MIQAEFDFDGLARSPKLAPTAELRQAVFDFVVSRGYFGGTDGEIAAALGPYRADSLRARRCELVRSGHIRDSLRRRSSRSRGNATVWISTGKPLTEVDQ